MREKIIAWIGQMKIFAEMIFFAVPFLSLSLPHSWSGERFLRIEDNNYAYRHDPDLEFLFCFRCWKVSTYRVCKLSSSEEVLVDTDDEEEEKAEAEVNVLEKEAPVSC